MITDINLRVSDDQDLSSADDETVLSDGTIDLSVARDIGEGKPLYMHFAITEAFAGGDTCIFEIIASDSDSLSSPVVLASTGEIDVADLELGKSITLAFGPMVGSNGYRYIGAQYVVEGTNTAGKVTADIVETIQDGRKTYASGFVVA